jgi:hypothetical protein
MFKKLNKIILIVFLIVLVSACKKEKENDANDLLLLGLIAATNTPYITVTPTSGSISIASSNITVTKSYDPKCSGVSGNQTFKFYLKKGNSKNLLVNFMGGGACWDGKNCFGTNTTTYFKAMDSLSALAVRYAFNGIMDERLASNPFRDYNVLFIPYCSGDLHWGSKATTYTDPTTNATTILQHKGFDNFLASIDYVKKNSDWTPTSSDKIFVVGQSAGAYGAIFNFPYIKEIFPSNEVHVLADAGNGIVPSNWQTEAAIGKWGADSNLASWVTGTSITTDLGVFFQKVAAFYPSSRVGQYSTNFDGTQRYFYNVQQLLQTNLTYSDSSSLYGKSDGTQVSDSVTCDWVTKSRTNFSTAKSQNNYRYYIAGGDVHTITTSNNVFTEASGGSSLLTWINGMIANNSDWANKDCRAIGSCSPPATTSSPNGVSCSFSTF